MEPREREIITPSINRANKYQKTFLNFPSRIVLVSNFFLGIRQAFLIKRTECIVHRVSTAV